MGNGRKEELREGERGDGLGRNRQEVEKKGEEASISNLTHYLSNDMGCKDRPRYKQKQSSGFQ